MSSGIKKLLKYRIREGKVICNDRSLLIWIIFLLKVDFVNQILKFNLLLFGVEIKSLPNDSIILI